MFENMNLTDNNFNQEDVDDSIQEMPEDVIAENFIDNGMDVDMENIWSGSFW